MKMFIKKIFKFFPYIAYLFLLAPIVDFEPIWDSHQYFTELATATNMPFSFTHFNLAGHLSFGLAFIVSISQILIPETSWSLNIQSVLFGFLGIYLFSEILKYVRGLEDRGIERTLLTLIFVVQPIYLASTIEFNLDFGGTILFLGYVLLLLKERFAWAAVCGTLMCLSKETFILVWFVWTLSFMVSFYSRCKMNWVPFMQRFALLLLPGVLFLVSAFYFMKFESGTLSWIEGFLKNQSLGSISSASLRISDLQMYGRRFAALGSTAFLIQFGWIWLIPIGFYLGRLIRSSIKNTDRSTLGEPNTLYGTLWLSLIPLSILLTTIPQINNPRYILVLIPLYLLIGIKSVLEMVPKFRFRMVFWMTILLCTMGSIFETIDPVAQRIFGTFTLGTRKLLHMTSRTGECCGFGRDQLVYNLQFVKIEALMNRALERVWTESLDGIVLYRDDFWMLPGYFDEKTFEMRAFQGSRIHWQTPEMAMLNLTKNNVVYLDFDFDYRPKIQSLFRGTFRQVAVQTISEDGYEIKLRYLRRK